MRRLVHTPDNTPNMVNKKEESFGVIVVCRTGKEDMFLLVRQLDHWGFSKGHAEGNETPVVTARRELMEECSVSDITIIPGMIFRDKYTFEQSGALIDKEVLLFLGTVENTECSPQQGEILECGYFPYDKARESLSFEGAKHILDEAKKNLENIPR